MTRPPETAILPAPAAPRPPAWEHQRRMTEHVLARQASMLNAGMGCLAGDAVIHVNRAGNGRRFKLAYVVERTLSGSWTARIRTMIRCLKADGSLGLAPLVGVKDTGVRETFVLTLRSGRWLRMTADHEVMTPLGKRPLRSLRAGDAVLIAEAGGRSHRGTRQGRIKTDLSGRTADGKFIDKDGYVRVFGIRHPRETTSGVYEHLLVAEAMLGRALLPGEEVHHINRIRSDNRPENLKVCRDRAEHMLSHDNRANLPGVMPAADEVASIAPSGVAERVYDLSIDDDAHTYIANGIVVGNTGKSRSVIDAADQSNVATAITICPLSVVDVWRRQLETWSSRPWMICTPQRGTVKERTAEAALALERANAARLPIMLVVNYDSAWRPPMAGLLLGRAWDLFVGDELHKSKSPTGRASRFLEKLRPHAKRRVGLTGTMMPHSPLDVYAQFRALDPDVFGTSFVRFRARYADVDTSPGFPKIRGYRNQDELAARMRPLTIVVGREVLTLPPAIHETREVTLGPESARVYRELKENLVSEVEAGSITPDNALVQLIRLQQVTSGHVGLDPDVLDATSSIAIIGTEKEDALVDLLDCIEPSEPLVAFCRFRPDLDAVHRAAFRTGRKSAELSGRRRELAAWQAPTGPQVLAAQIQSGSVGVDMTRARYCVFFSLGFAWGDYDQALARVHRPGQERTTFYYHLIAKDTIDLAVYGAMRRKEDAALAVIGEILKGRPIGQGHR